MKVDYSGLSEVGAATVRRAHKVRNFLSRPTSYARVSAYFMKHITHVAAVEIEVSPQSYEQQTKDGKHRLYFSRLPTPGKLINIHGFSDRHL